MEPIYKGREVVEVGRYDANCVWFTWADINGIGLSAHSHECARTPMGPWIMRTHNPGHPYREEEIDRDTLYEVVGLFHEARKAREKRC